MALELGKARSLKGWDCRSCIRVQRRLMEPSIFGEAPAGERLSPVRFDLRDSQKSAMEGPMSAAVKTRVERKKSVFIVDDHPLLREGLSRLINQQTDVKVCGEAPTASQALRMMPRLKPDIAIVDITLPGSSGMDLIKNMKLRSL